jgi:hypothetical protein
VVGIVVPVVVVVVCVLLAALALCGFLIFRVTKKKKEEWYVHVPSQAQLSLALPDCVTPGTSTSMSSTWITSWVKARSARSTRANGREPRWR